MWARKPVGVLMEVPRVGPSPMAAKVAPRVALDEDDAAFEGGL